MSRVAYFKNVNPTVGLDASQNQMLNTLQGQIATKAEQADLTINYGSVGDVLMSNGSAGSMWSSTFNDDIMGLNNYVQELQSFFNNFQQCLFLSDASGSEVDYNILVNGPAKSLSASSVLENEIIELKSYMNQVKLFFSQFKESIYISDSSGVEINYNNLL